MIFYGNKNVYEAAKDRIRGIFHKHYGKVPISVSFSGGKDSTTVLYLTKEVMDELGIEKISVFWCDQEFEAPQVVEYIRYIQSLPWVDMLWVQAKYPKFNAHSGKMEYVWDDSREWLREKESKYTSFDLSDYKSYSSEYEFFLSKLQGEGSVTIGGLHIDESPVRRLALFKQRSSCPCMATKVPIYYPVFDWSYQDIWYYIYKKRLPYCKLYNYLFSKSPLQYCRVGSFWNEQSLRNLYLLREISPRFYDKASCIIPGLNTTKQTYNDFAQFIRHVPPYFASREEYVMYLIDNLVPANKRKVFKHAFFKKIEYLEKKRDKGYCELSDNEIIEKVGISLCICILRNDYGLRALANIR